MKKIINPWRNHEGYNCFGCSPDNPIGLHMEFYEDGDYIVSTWHPEHRLPTTEPELTIRAKVSKQVRNLAYISAEITNSKGALGRRTLATNGTQELCNEGEAIYFLMNEEKAKEMGFLHCEVEDD